MFDREEDDFLNELLTNDTAFAYWTNGILSSSASSVTNSLFSDHNDHYVIYVKKKKYQRKTERLERTHIKVLLRGVNPIMSYFLLLLQMCPDTVTNISDIQLKQSLADMERSQVSCKFNVKNTRLYDLSPVHFLATLEDDLKQLTINHQNISPTETGQGEDELIGMKERKRKLDSRKIEKMEKHKFLFDPISGIFLQSRFQRSEALIQNSLDGSLTFVLDRNKRIESIIISPKEKVQLPQKEV
eukprot:gene11193-12194_t